MRLAKSKDEPTEAPEFVHPISEIDHSILSMHTEATGWGVIHPHWSAEEQAFLFQAPVGAATLIYHDPVGEERVLAIQVKRGGSEYVFELQPAEPFRFDVLLHSPTGEVLKDPIFMTRISVKAVSGSGRELPQPELFSPWSSKAREGLFHVTKAGDYKLSFDRIDGYAAIVGQTVTVVAGERSHLLIELIADP